MIHLSHIRDTHATHLQNGPSSREGGPSTEKSEGMKGLKSLTYRFSFLDDDQPRWESFLLTLF